MADRLATMGTWVIGLLIVSLIWYPMMWSALMISASERYLGRHIETGEAIRRAFGKFGTLFACWIAKWLILILGLFLLLIPWFYFIARYFAVPATTLFENRGIGESFRRSSQLSIGQKGRILGTLLLAWAIIFGISFAVSMVVSIILVASLATRGADAMSGTSSLLLQLPNMFAYILGLPIIVITQTLLYYDVRIRQEGYDIELMSAQLGGAGTEVAAH
jgi:hypothetical protein